MGEFADDPAQDQPAPVDDARVEPSNEPAASVTSSPIERTAERPHRQDVRIRYWVALAALIGTIVGSAVGGGATVVAAHINADGARRAAVTTFERSQRISAYTKLLDAAQTYTSDATSAMSLAGLTDYTRQHDQALSEIPSLRSSTLKAVAVYVTSYAALQSACGLVQIIGSINVVNDCSALATKSQRLDLLMRAMADRADCGQLNCADTSYVLGDDPFGTPARFVTAEDQAISLADEFSQIRDGALEHDIRSDLA